MTTNMIDPIGCHATQGAKERTATATIILSKYTSKWSLLAMQETATLAVLTLATWAL